VKKVVLITGVAGDIGKATAQIFAEFGWYVVGVDQQKTDSLDGVTRFIQADLSEPAGHKKIFEEISVSEGRLNALVNNAAVQICKPLLETSLEEWDTIMSNNVRSVFLAVLYVYPLLCQQRGAIVNVSSVHAIATSRNIAAYAASKGALLALTRAMALEFGLDGIRVNAVLPGAVNSKMLREGLKRGHVEGNEVNDQIRKLSSKHIMGRLGSPNEIGRAILFLADNDQSSFMTGQALIVDGGATARLSTE
jgi:NAD(P)-dependent dehydrogenase (short-subunit alcohol dehydrogenase family)